jgi:hypothetical protein
MKVVRLVLPLFETARWEHLASKSLWSISLPNLPTSIPVRPA